MADKSTAIHDLMRGYEQFRAPLEALDDGAYGETWLGEWNLSQLLAHMAGWYREMTAAIARTSRGERPTPAGVDYSDAAAWNATFATKAEAGRSALAARTTLTSSQRKITCPLLVTRALSPDTVTSGAAGR